LGVQLVIIQKQVDGFGNFHAPPPVFDGIMLMLIFRAYHNFLRKFDKFLSWQDILIGMLCSLKKLRVYRSEESGITLIKFYKILSYIMINFQGLCG
jgi:hypothetical protein